MNFLINCDDIRTERYESSYQVNPVIAISLMICRRFGVMTLFLCDAKTARTKYQTVRHWKKTEKIRKMKEWSESDAFKFSFQFFWISNFSFCWRILTARCRVVVHIRLHLKFKTFQFKTKKKQILFDHHFLNNNFHYLIFSFFLFNGK